MRIDWPAENPSVPCAARRCTGTGQFVIGSFVASDNTCPNCRAGYQSGCQHAEFVGTAQAPLLRVPLADGTLVATPLRAAQMRQEGHIQAGGVDKDVTFVVEVDDDVNHEIDIAYRAKYRRYGGRYVNPMVVAEARAATIKLVPRSTGPMLTRRKNRGK
jgi:hypothetical protein